MAATGSFKVEHYMFCHPGHVVLRKGKSRLLNWKHLMPTAELRLSIKLSPLEQQIQSLHLSEGVHILEELSPFHKYATRSMTVIVMEKWISFRWVTRKGITQFQCELLSSKIVQHIASHISNSGIHVIQKNADEKVEFKMTSSSFLLEFNSQSTQVSSEEANPNKEPSLAQQQSIRGCGAQNSQELTQVEPKTLKLTEQNLHDSGCGNCSVCSFMSGPGRSIRNSDYISIFGQASRVSTKMRKETSELCNIDIEKLILSRKALNLVVETYSFALSSRGPLRWKHMGLVSNVCLSLVPCDQHSQPIILLSRGTEVIESFVPYKGRLRTFFTNDILALRQFNGDSQAHRCFQIHMKQANIAVTCEWLSYYDIQSEDPIDTTPFTEATTMRPVSNRKTASSEISFGSRQSQFWARRLQSRGAEPPDSVN